MLLHLVVAAAVAFFAYGQGRKDESAKVEPKVFYRNVAILVGVAYLLTLFL